MGGQSGSKGQTRHEFHAGGCCAWSECLAQSNASQIWGYLNASVKVIEWHTEGGDEASRQGGTPGDPIDNTLIAGPCL